MAMSIQAIQHMTGMAHPSGTNPPQPERYDLIKLAINRFQAVISDLHIVSAQQPSRLQVILGELEALGRIPDPPSKHARHTAKFYILETYAQMMSAFASPRFVADDEHGIIITWSNNGRRVRLSCRGHIHQENYLYYQSPEVYDIEPELTPGSLKRRLEWLNAA